MSIEVQLNDYKESMRRKFLEYGLPEYMWFGYSEYVCQGLQPGDFLKAVASNDFIGAVSRADENNAAKLKEWAWIFYNVAPMECHGSKEKMQEWMNRGGLRDVLLKTAR